VLHPVLYLSLPLSPQKRNRGGEIPYVSVVVTTCGHVSKKKKGKEKTNLLAVMYRQ
jgi:hypothetical protein